MSASNPELNPIQWLTMLQSKYSLKDDETAELRRRAEAEHWSPVDEPGKLTAIGAAGIEMVSREMVASTWPSAPPEVVLRAVDIMLPSLFRACDQGRFDIEGTDDVGREVQELLKPYPADLSFLE